MRSIESNCFPFSTKLMDRVRWAACEFVKETHFCLTKCALSSCFSFSILMLRLCGVMRKALLLAVILYEEQEQNQRERTFCAQQLHFVVLGTFLLLSLFFTCFPFQSFLLSLFLTVWAWKHFWLFSFPPFSLLPCLESSTILLHWCASINQSFATWLFLFLLCVRFQLCLWIEIHVTHPFSFRLICTVPCVIVSNWSYSLCDGIPSSSSSIVISFLSFLSLFCFLSFLFHCLPSFCILWFLISSFFLRNKWKS